MYTKRNAKLSWCLTGLVLLGWATASSAQVPAGTAGGSGGAGGFGGAGGGAGGAGSGGAAGTPGFQGGQALQGGLGALGQQGGAGQSGNFTQQLAPASNSGYGTTSFLGPYYANPLSLGIPSSTGNSGSSGVMGSSKPTFGQALYNSSSAGGGQFGSSSGASNFGSRQSSTFGGSGSSSRTSAGGGQSRTSTSTRQGGSSYGGNRTGGNIGGQGGVQGSFGGGGVGGAQGASNGPRAVEFQTTLGYPLPAGTPARVRADLQAVIARSSALPSRTQIQTMAQGEGVVLRGTVGSDQERRLAEAIVKLSPGVVEIRNELQVREPPPPIPSP